MPPTRRDLVKLALGTGAWLAGSALLGCGSKRKGQPPPPERRAVKPAARHFVVMLLSGGHDTVYTTDPKLAKDVDPMVTLPSANQIATGGELRFGPHFAPLARWGSELAILNGVQVRTVNHETGQKQFFHLKTDIADGMPSVVDVLATRRDGQPLGAAYLNLSFRTMHSPGYFGTADRFYYGKVDVFDQVAQARPGELAVLAKALRREASGIAPRGAGWREAEQTAIYLREVADFFDAAADVPPLVTEPRSTDYTIQSMADTIERALWLLEHDLCCGVVLDLGLLGWDTHLRNEARQTEMNGQFATFFDEYLNELHARSNRHGVLADQTVTVVGSELGRFPHQNEMLGKDHLPQTSFLFAGPGIRAGKVYGRTGRRMEGLPISYRTGEPAQAGRIPVLDDVGTTLLRLAGVDPERYGYGGRVCEFLLDGTA